MGREVVRCPGCRYDLYGLPDGVCPECGRAFTWEKLRAALDRRRHWSWRDRRVALFGLAMGIWTAIVFGWLGLGELTYLWGRDAGVWGRGTGLWDLGGQMEFLAVMWVFTALWCVHWFHDRPKRPLVLLWIWLPTLRTALLLASLRTPEYQPLMVFEVLLGLAMLAWPFWREPVRSLWSTATLFAALAAVLGAAYLLTGLVGTAAGEWWSIWEDPRPGVIYDQYPLTNSEAVTAGAALLGIAAVVAGALVVTARRVWSDRTD